MKDWRRRERMGSSGRQCPHATMRAQQDLSFTVGSTALTMAWKWYFGGGKMGGECVGHIIFLMH